MAALLLVGLFLSGHNNTAIGSSNPVPMIAMILSNQSAAAYSPAVPRAENRLPAEHNQWTLRAPRNIVISAVLDAEGANDRLSCDLCVLCRLIAQPPQNPPMAIDKPRAAEPLSPPPAGNPVAPSPVSAPVPAN